MNTKEDTKVKKQINPNIQAHLLQGTLYVLLLVMVCAIPFALGQRNASKPESPTKLSQRTLTWKSGCRISTPSSMFTGVIESGRKSVQIPSHCLMQ